MAGEEKSHLLPFGDGGWATWRDVVVRGAGFPAETAQALTDPQLAHAADAAVHDVDQRQAYLEEHQSAAERLSAAIQQLARSRRLREAVTWQNPKLIKLCLDKLAAGEARTARGRGHEQAVANYVQRYSVKNDTVGFTGPVGWARWAEDGPPLATKLGERFLARRTVYFEVWAIDAVAQALAADPEVRPWLTPRLYAAHRLDGATLHVPGRAPVTLTAREAAALGRVDGVSSVPDLAVELAGSQFPDLGDPTALLAALDELASRGLVRLDLMGGVEAFPERTLLARLERIAHPEVRDRVIGVVRNLVAARDRVSASAGDDVALEAALAELAHCFQAITGMAGERKPGRTYAGRTLVYEDTVRDARVALGPAAREELAQPLCLLLDSARWLVAEIGQEWDRYFLGLYERRCGQLGSPDVPLAAILSLATPQLFFNARQLPQPTQRAVAEFQRRWAAILRLPPDASEVRLRSVDLAERVAELFPPRPAPWPTAIYHSPDVMLAAADVDAVERGEHLFVLGELHLSVNTMESRLFVEQHDDPASLLAAAEADLGDRRVYHIPSKNSPLVTSRGAPPTALLSPLYTYWAAHLESVTPPAPIISAADLVVRREDGHLSVRSTSGALQAPLSVVLGETLSATSANAFKPLARGSRNPRIVLDNLVIGRQSWTFRADDVGWAAMQSEADRFLGARSWRLRHGLPERVFYTVPVEDKPTFVDFRSLVYVNILAKLIRRSAERENGSVTLTEMLPDPSQLWLSDADGSRYTCELRMLAVDQRRTEP